MVADAERVKGWHTALSTEVLAGSLAQRLTFCRSSWLSGGCLCRLWGRMTVRRSGRSARRAPRITAALVPAAPDVKM